MKNSKLYWLIGLSFWLSTVQAQQSSFFMRNNYFSNEINPALMPAYKYIINPLPLNVHLSLNNSAFSLDDLLIQRGDSTLFSPSQLLGQLEGNNSISANMNVQALMFACRFWKMHANISYSVRGSLDVHYPRTLVDLAWKGNAPYLGQRINIAPRFNMQAWHEFALGLGGEIIKDKLYLGAKVKYYVGLMNVSTAEQAQLNVYTDDADYSVSLQTDYQINSSSFGASQELYQLLNDGTANWNSVLDNFSVFPKNRGWGLDFGLVCHPVKPLSLSLSVVDIGKITWRDQAHNLKTKGSFTFTGMTADDLQDSSYQETLVDSLVDAMKFQEGSDAYSTWMPTRIYLGANYDIYKFWSVGALVELMHRQENWTPSLMLNTQVKVGRWLNFGLSYSLRKADFDNLGINLAFDIGGFQLFALTDNVIPLFRPSAARAMDFRFGMLLGIAPIKEKKVKEPIE